MTHKSEEKELNHPNSETITDSNLKVEPDDSPTVQPQNDSNEEEEKDSVIFQNYRGKSTEELNQLLLCESISKNQKKKIRKQIKWNERTEERRLHRKQQKRDRREKARLLNKSGTKSRLNKTKTTENFDKLVHVAIDCKYDHLMSDQDLTKLGKQVAWCYKVNRRCEHPVQYHLCGMTQNLRNHLDPTHPNWDVHYHDSLEITPSGPSSNIVYLTAESDYVLDTLEPGLVYVIGGLVDHNHQKGYCHQLAEKQQLRTARLPLSENVDMKTRRVLTVNHVFEILLAYRSTQDWKSAILKVLPEKKLNNDRIGKNERRKLKLAAMREKENEPCPETTENENKNEPIAVEDSKQNENDVENDSNSIYSSKDDTNVDITETSADR